ncbi:glycosyl hydrolases family 18-domain-containing protein [Aspergillus taichungensis]|uniref:chitinase n=1 Tax=Aspergillus taichungensis TaxID=482145 RepID=A0A2J5I1R9_9EURO|nr:glycosyl hydrolases family 18-domain-containing protein [Aspergillus taichungensis]
MARGILSLLIFAFVFLSSVLAEVESVDYYDNIRGVSLAPLRTLLQNDEYVCSKKKPCKNGACCGKSGHCGFGKKYCGTTGKSPNDACWSNCDAHAECGKDAKKPGTKCPLNVCCSEYGFCGTTEEFCGEGCQNNCKQPGSGASDGNVQERIIGYYEAWNHDKSCMGMKIHQIPVESLTHVNYAFAYISPDDYEIGPMPDVPEKTLSQFTALKERNPKVVLGVSLGGWTFNDNHTDTQAVFADLSSTAKKRSKFIKNLISFMRHYGFNSVDIDWEYPGAPDRQPRDWDGKDDGKNYVKLMKDIRQAFKDEGLDFELSFTAPTSYWYLRWFEIHEMVEASNYVNLMSYDLHGIWDANSTIGKHVLGHTNLTEIDLALDLLWRNKVPAKKVNLGLAFYSRTFELKDKKCDKPGCIYKGGGKKGACTDTEGILAYSEIVDIIAKDDLTPVYDKEFAIKYIVWNDNQWISYDDQQTFQQKIKFANKKGLGGLLLWAIDQDDRNRDALRGVLYPQDLVMTDSLKDDTSYWESQHPGNCVTTECGKKCGAGYIEMTDFDCPDGDGVSRICCPISAAPDPKTCNWRGGPPLCNGQCHGGEVALASAVDGGNGHCSDGRQFYCCPIPEVAAGGGINCGWKDECSDDQEIMTFAGTFLTTISDTLDFTGLIGQKLGDILDDIDMDNRRSYCCSKQEIKNWKDCYWAGGPGRGIHSCDDNHCETGIEVELTLSPYGEGEDCFPTARQRAFCCTPQSGETPFLPVPLEYLFPNPPLDDSSDPDFNLQIDDTWGTGDTQVDDEDEPDDAAFGFVVITAPDEVHVSLDKRDGSPWELMGCPDSDSEEAHTIRMFCADPTSGRCDHIHRGDGVPGTILQMPPRCGPGRYAVAKSFDVSEDQSLPGHLANVKRDLGGASVYDLTFDYDFQRVPRAFGEAQMRIDFSNQPGYWDSVVDRPAEGKEERHMNKMKRSETGYHKNRKRWIEDEWRDAYHLGGMDRGQLHKRWFGEGVLNWLANLIVVGKAEVTEELNHKVNEKVELVLIDQQFGPCPVGPAQAQANIKSTITAELDVETSFGLTIITTLHDGLNLSNSYLYFKNKGEVKARFELDAVASLTYSTGDIKLIGLDDFPGATFRVPGVVTVGPNLAVYASADASLVVSGHLEAAVTLASWEVQQTYPQTKEHPPEALDKPDRDGTQTIGDPTFDFSVQAHGEIALHLKPTVTFGVVFDKRWKVDRCSADLVLDGYIVAHADAGYSRKGDNSCPFHYGIDAGSTIYAQLAAPDMFGWGGEHRITLSESPRKQITPDTCPKEEDEDEKKKKKKNSTSKRATVDALDLAGEYLSPAVRGNEALKVLSPMHMHGKRDTLTLGPLVTIPDSFLNCPGDENKSNGSACALCSLFGESDDSKSEKKTAVLTRRDEGDSCPYYPPGDNARCSKSDFTSRDPQDDKTMSLSWLGSDQYVYSRYPRCNAKNNGPSNVAKWYLPEFMTANQNLAVNDPTRCSAKTIKQSTTQVGGDWLVNGLAGLPTSDFRTEHIFEVHLVKHFLEWVCAGSQELSYTGLTKLPFPKGWGRPNHQWCEDLFGDPESGGLAWKQNGKGSNINWIQQTANVLGSNDNDDLLVMYHDKPNGVKKVITEGHKPGYGTANEKGTADAIMMSATVFDYLRTLESKWTKPSKDIEKICDDFDKQYESRKPFQTTGKELKKPAKPKGVTSWGLRTLWCYWIDNHLSKVEQVQSAWLTASRAKMDGFQTQAATDFITQVIDSATGAAYSSKFKFPQPNAGKPLPGQPGGAANDNRNLQM